MIRRLLPAAALLLPLGTLPLPAAAQQQSQSYKFLESIRKGDGNAVIATLDQPGQTIINTRDVTTGEGALHIVVKRGDSAYLRYLLAKGADPNLRDREGETAMMLAVQAGQPEMVQILANAKANANLADGSGETPLIRAVQRRDVTMVRTLLASKADPDQRDIIAGLSARDYAQRDTRAPLVTKLLADAPRQARAAVSGPKL